MIALDFGSNTLRAVKMDANARVLARAEYIVQTARGLKKSGLISKLAIKSIKAALNDLKARGFELKGALAVGTAAYRKAKNADILKAELYSLFGFELLIICAKKEAFYSQLALKYEYLRLGFEGDFYFCDLGGASMELGFKDDFISLDCGIISLYEKSLIFNIAFKKLGLKYKARKYKGAGGYKKSWFKKQARLNSLAKNKSQFSYLHKNAFISFKQLKASFKNDKAIAKAFINKAKLLVMNSGTPSLLAAYKQGIYYKYYDASSINGQIFDKNAFLPLIFKLLKDKNKTAFLGINKLEYLLIGAFILQSLNKDALIIDSGVCEGLCLKALNKV